jgi:hypothetical protein
MYAPFDTAVQEKICAARVVATPAATQLDES